MEKLLNPGSELFQMSLNSEIYVDKSDLLIHTNRLIRTNQRFICVVVHVASEKPWLQV